jgi:hypothetical protein
MYVNSGANLKVILEIRNQKVIGTRGNHEGNSRGENTQMSSLNI